MTHPSGKMVPSREQRALIALLVAFAAVSLQLQPSAAISIPPIFPCIPGLPKIPFLPCYEPPQPPAPAPPPPSEEEDLTDCWGPLTKLTPCAGFLTNSSVSSPPGACCDGFQFVVHHAAICFCHYSNGDIGKIVPGPLNSTRLFGLSGACGSIVSLEAFAHCDMEDVPPMTPTSPPPSLPPAA